MCNYKGDTSSDVLMESPPSLQTTSALGQRHFQVFIIPGPEGHAPL